MRLCPAEILLIEGPDALRFAHAQFCGDVQSLAPGAWQWNAWLDAQGRVRHFFALLRTGDERLLAWQPLGSAAAMREALARYVLRAKLALQAPEGWALHAAGADELAEAPAGAAVVDHAGGHALRMPGAPERIAWLAPPADGACDATALEAWRLADVALGLPLVAAELSGAFVPQALGLERFDAIRFDKGCYPGQEIAARLHFRGGNKRHLRRLRFDAPPPAPGTAVASGGAEAGTILYAAPASAGSAALAVVADAFAAEPLEAAGAAASSITAV